MKTNFEIAVRVHCNFSIDETETQYPEGALTLTQEEHELLNAAGRRIKARLERMFNPPINDLPETASIAIHKRKDNVQ